MIREKILSHKWAVGLVACLAALAAVVPLSASAAPTTLTIAGSTTVTPIVQQTQAAFQSLYGNNVQVVLNTTDSGQGLNAILQGSGSPWNPNPLCDIAMASRAVKNSDDQGTGTSGAGDPLSKLGWKGNTSALADCGWKIGKDGICIVVYDRPGQSDPLDVVDNITTSQIQQIYQAQDGITTLKWSDLNPSWPATNIIPRMREATSGTRGSFEALVPVDAAKDLATFNALNAAHGNAYPVLPGNPEMATAINGGSDPGAIGYVGLGFTAGENSSYPNVRALNVADTTHSPAANGGVPTTPTTSTILNSSYALARDLYLYTTQPSYYNHNNLYIARYLRYIFSTAGQDAVVAAGFVRVDQNRWNVDAKGVTNVLDVGQVAAHWNENTKAIYPSDAGNMPTANVAGIPGWARYDCNADGQVNVLDVGQIASHWNQP